MWAGFTWCTVSDGESACKGSCCGETVEEGKLVGGDAYPEQEQDLVTKKRRDICDVDVLWVYKA